MSALLASSEVHFRAGLRVEQFIRRPFFCAQTRDIRVKAVLLFVASIGMLGFAAAIPALDAQTVAKLGAEDAAAKVEAVHALVASGDEEALALLQAVQAGGGAGSPGRPVVVIHGGKAFDAAPPGSIAPFPPQIENNAI